MHSVIAKNATLSQSSFMLLPVFIGVLSYIYHHKLNALKLRSVKN